MVRMSCLIHCAECSYWAALCTCVSSSPPVPNAKQSVAQALQEVKGLSRRRKDKLLHRKMAQTVSGTIFLTTRAICGMWDIQHQYGLHVTDLDMM